MKFVWCLMLMSLASGLGQELLMSDDEFIDSLLREVKLDSNIEDITTESPTPPAPSTRPYQITDSLLAFSANLSGGLPAGGNAVFSPLSVVSLLNLFLLGASGNTRTQLRSALSYPDQADDVTIHRQFGIQLRALESTSAGNLVHVANRVFADTILRPTDAYEHNLRTFYEADVERLTLSADDGTARDHINGWVKNETGGLIASILTEPVPAATVLIGANVVLFNSTWVTPFDPKLTMPLSFSVGGAEKVMADMMLSVMTLPFARFDNFDAVALPYQGFSQAMYVFLPDKAGEKHVLDVEQYVRQRGLKSIVDALAPEEISVSLPRFSMQHSIDLSGVLQQMGVNDLFDPARVNLGQLTESGGVYLSEVLHQAVIEVTERGTTAAGATVGLTNRGRLRPEFHARRPFLFIILDTRTAVPLFWGRVVRPTSSSSQQ